MIIDPSFSDSEELISEVYLLDQEDKILDAINIIEVQDRIGLSLAYYLCRLYIINTNLPIARRILNQMKEIEGKTIEMVVLELELKLLEFRTSEKTITGDFIEEIRNAFSISPADTKNNSYWVARLKIIEGDYYSLQNEPGKALLSYNSSLEYLSSNIKEYARVLINMGNMYHMKGDFKSAIAYYERSLEHIKDLNNPRMKAGLANNLGAQYRQLGDFERSLSYYNDSLTIAKQLNLTGQISALLNNIGIIYFYKGELDEAIYYYKESLSIRIEMGNKVQVGYSYQNIGEAYQNLGRLNLALEYQKKSIIIAEEIKNDMMLAKSYENVGTLYRMKGEVTEAIEFFQLSHRLKEKLGNTIEISNTLYKLAMAYYARGNHKEALKCQEQSLEHRLQIGNELEISSNLFELFKIHVELQDETHLHDILHRLEDIAHHKRNNVIQLRLQLAQALMMKISDRTLLKFESLRTFRNICTQKIIDFDLTIFAYIQQMDLLLYELSLSYHKEVFDDLTSLNQEMLKIAQSQKMFSLEAEGLLLRAKLFLISLDLEKAKEYLARALMAAEKYDLKLLAAKIYEEQINFEDNLSFWAASAKGDSLSSRIKQTNIQEHINTMGTSRALTKIHIKKEVPVMLMILYNTNGLSIYSKKFDRTMIDEILVSSFISAVNAFGKATFEIKNNIEKIKQGEYSIILQSIGEISILYIYKFESYHAVIQQNNIINALKADEAIWISLQKFNGKITKNLMDQIDLIIEQTFEIYDLDYR
ncbi:MAG: tetratricopeptide repeat protein [Candidatus Heimdallarchaeota archaeon]|nr:tetratricopeptide repeat protein [Candidatus Heimdallarchaeota archaeon]